MDDLPEYIEKEIPNDKKIDNDHQTVLVVANYLDKNPDIAQHYDYLVDWRSTSDESNQNFMAKFRLKPQFRHEVARSSRYVYQAGVPMQSNVYYREVESYGGYYYEKENLGPVGEKYYSEPVEYEYAVDQRPPP